MLLVALEHLLLRKRSGKGLIRIDALLVFFTKEIIFYCSSKKGRQQFLVVWRAQVQNKSDNLSYQGLCCRGWCIWYMLPGKSLPGWGGCHRSDTSQFQDGVF